MDVVLTTARALLVVLGAFATVLVDAAMMLMKTMTAIR
jgi:hypothetical protein